MSVMICETKPKVKLWAGNPPERLLQLLLLYYTLYYIIIIIFAPTNFVCETFGSQNVLITKM